MLGFCKESDEGVKCKRGGRREGSGYKGVSLSKLVKGVGFREGVIGMEMICGEVE